MADKDFYDRIADALEIISGDNSHINDIDPKMDYYERIAKALQKIATSGSNNANNCNCILHIHQTQETNNIFVLNYTWKEINDAKFSVLITEEGEFMYIAEIFEDEGNYVVIYKSQQSTKIFSVSSENGYPQRQGSNEDTEAPTT